MKMKTVDELSFYTIIGKCGADLTGVDVGRTHGIHYYTRKYGSREVGNHTWTGSGSMRKNYYEIASYLWEAYGK